MNAANLNDCVDIIPSSQIWKNLLVVSRQLHKQIGWLLDQQRVVLSGPGSVDVDRENLVFRHIRNTTGEGGVLPALHIVQKLKVEVDRLLTNGRGSIKFNFPTNPYLKALDGRIGRELELRAYTEGTILPLINLETTNPNEKAWNEKWQKAVALSSKVRKFFEKYKGRLINKGRILTSTIQFDVIMFYMVCTKFNMDQLQLKNHPCIHPFIGSTLAYTDNLEFTELDEQIMSYIQEQVSLLEASLQQ